MFPGNPNVPLPCSQTPAGPRRLAFTALRYCSRRSNNESPSIWLFRGSITRLQHWLFTLRAALSDDYAKLASGGGQPFPGGIPVYPLSSGRELWVFRAPPLSLGWSWRDGTPDLSGSLRRSKSHPGSRWSLASDNAPASRSNHASRASSSSSARPAWFRSAQTVQSGRQ